MKTLKPRTTSIMKTCNIAPRPAAHQRQLNALWKRLDNDEKRTQATRDAINRLLNAERLELLPSTDD